MDAVELVCRAHAAGLKLSVAGDRLQVNGPRSAEPIVSLLVAAKAEVIALLRPESASLPNAVPEQQFPSPDDWITGRGIGPETVGIDRYQHGGRPHCLRPDLRRRWRDVYAAGLQAGLEEQAWRAAWQAVAAQRR